MEYPELIARVVSHIPDKGQVLVRYYGLYANAHRGQVRKTNRIPSARSSARRDSGPPDLEFLTLAQDRIILLFVMGRVAPVLC